MVPQNYAKGYICGTTVIAYETPEAEGLPLQGQGALQIRHRCAGSNRGQPHLERRRRAGSRSKAGEAGNWENSG
jgi:hypothetical protein